MLSTSHRFLGAFAAVVLLLGSASQALALHRCGAVVRSSCSCQAKDSSQQPSTLSEGRATCCTTISAPSNRKEAALQGARLNPLPAAVFSAAGSVAPVSLMADRALLGGVSPPAPHGSPLILLNCSLLI